MKPVQDRETPPYPYSAGGDGVGGQAMKSEELLGMKPMPEDGTGYWVPWQSRPASDWYSWFINEWLPSKGEDHMKAFVVLDLNPVKYLAWALAKEGHFDHKPEFRDAILEVYDRRCRDGLSDKP